MPGDIIINPFYVRRRRENILVAIQHECDAHSALPLPGWQTPGACHAGAFARPALIIMLRATAWRILHAKFQAGQQLANRLNIGTAHNAAGCGLRLHRINGVTSVSGVSLACCPNAGIYRRDGDGKVTGLVGAQRFGIGEYGPVRRCQRVLAGMVTAA